MNLKRTFLASLLAITVLAGAGVAGASPHDELDAAARATAPFKDLATAQAAGYTVRVADVHGIECIAQPGAGTMGVHYLNPSLLDGTIDATKPELLVYEPRNGHLTLVAVEYLVFVSDWEGAHRPSLFGVPFGLTAEPNRYGLPPFYALHAWLWKRNPSGIFSPWNPQVSCG
jgi:hypothetical protein